MKLRYSEQRLLNLKAEEYFVALLLKTGYAILERNYFLPKLGEIDIIANCATTLLCIEVKAMKLKNLEGIKTYDAATEALTVAKKIKIYRTFMAYINKNSFHKHNLCYYLACYYEDRKGALVSTTFNKFY